MGYRDELAAAQERIAALEKELDEGRRSADGAPVEWTPREVVELRRLLYEARTEAAREQRRCAELASALDAERARTAHLQDELASAHRRYASAQNVPRPTSDVGAAALIGARMYARVLAPTVELLRTRAPEHDSFPPMEAASAEAVAAFARAFGPRALEALSVSALPRRVQELAVRVASSIYLGEAFHPDDCDPSIRVLRAVGWDLPARGECLWGSAARGLSIAARRDGFSLRYWAPPQAKVDVAYGVG